VVKVHCNEGRAIHIGPKPCVSSREAGGEASVGESAGQVLSRVSRNSRVPTRSATWKATLLGAFSRVPAARRGRGPWHAQKLSVQEPGDLQLDRSHGWAARIGKARSRSR